MFRMYVDEVGTDALTNLQVDRHRYLSLTGVVMEVPVARDMLEPNFNHIKAELFGHDPDSPLIFHRSDIMGGKGPFQPIREKTEFRTEFDKRILSVFSETPYVVITALVDKLWMAKQDHWAQTHPYHYLTRLSPLPTLASRLYNGA